MIKLSELSVHVIQNFETLQLDIQVQEENYFCVLLSNIWGEGSTLEIFGWGCATGTLEPLAYTRARSSEFCYPILD